MLSVHTNRVCLMTILKHEKAKLKGSEDVIKIMHLYSIKDANITRKIDDQIILRRRQGEPPLSLYEIAMRVAVDDAIQEDSNKM